MIGAAFCPAHITGFFKADISGTLETTGSVGAGFSIREGVTTTVRVSADENASRVEDGRAEYVVEQFLRATRNEGRTVKVEHRVDVPVGYGLGSSGALSLSTAYALDQAFGTGVRREELGQMAHRAEVRHRSGLGDVLAAYHGGFEVRTKAGAPGYGLLEKFDVGDPSVLVVCISPCPTSKFWGKRMSLMNGIGGEMVGEMLKHRDTGLFQRMSMDFARRSGVVTPSIERVAGLIRKAGADCGVAMLGETVFTIIPPEDEEVVAEALRGYPVLRTRLDTEGAKVLA